MSQQLTAAAKRAITSEWARRLPTLTVLRPMLLLRRHGPLLVGLRLERRSASEYYPLVHYHVLAFPSEALTLDCARGWENRHGRGRRGIRVSQTDRFVDEAVAALSAACPQLVGPDRPVENYLAHVRAFAASEPPFAVVRLYRYLLAVLVLNDPGRDMTPLIEVAAREVADLPEEFLPEGVEAWKKELSALAESPSELAEQVAGQVEEHGLAGLDDYGLGPPLDLALEGWVSLATPR